MSTICELLTGEFEHELRSTRRVLGAVPDDRLDWRPHPRSFPMGRLAGHVAEIVSWTAAVLGRDRLELSRAAIPVNFRFAATSREELLTRLDEWSGEARAALAGVEESMLDQPWVMAFDGHEVLRLTRYQALRGFVLNHHIHHRAQLAVYLRMNDAKVPGIYGPSADEK